MVKHAHEGSAMKFPDHGRIQCRECWPEGHTRSTFKTADERFQLVNDPGAWGSSNPEVLVLGISKGFTQADAFATDEFDAVAFKDFRGRLKEVLVAVGVMAADANIHATMRASEQRFGWGSVVRCSLSGRNKKGGYGAGTPEVLPAFKHPEARRFLRGCTRRFLKHLPERTRTVVLLGNDDRYIQIFGAELQGLYGSGCRRLNAVAHVTDKVLWVHVAHPSRGNGHLGTFLGGDALTTQGRKLELARQALTEAAREASGRL